ncbi:MAG TPA: TolC family protein, partial [Steroidobacteraceae bacterium]|nr:TolC family protein [Steroidobacteraceae bacterium]
MTRPRRSLGVRRTRWVSGAAGLGLLAACAVGPDYHRPKLDAAADYKESGDWKPSEPNDVLSRGPWWEIYQDEALNQLEVRIDISNENVKAAAAAYDQARALVSQARAGFWPTISANVGRPRGSADGGPTQTTHTAGISGNWDLDIWGQIRRTTESNRASAQASAASLAAARLSAQSELATAYFELRAQDQLQRLLDDTVLAEQQSLQITESRYRFGVAARADVVSATAQLLSSQAQQVNAKIQRAILEHAIAVLIGQQPASFSLAPSAMRTDVPTVPAGI